MTRQTTDARAEFEDVIQSRAEIVECYAVSGEWDYLLRIAAQDVADYTLDLLLLPSLRLNSGDIA